jgi:hypothetical protein
MDFEIGLLLLAALNLGIAWRYSSLPLGQDEGLWLLWGFTDAVPYHDYVDCKPPGIHLWLRVLALMTGKRLWLTRFMHHATIGVIAVIATAFTHNLNVGIAYTALAQSAWLLSYHAWVECLSSAFLLLALLIQQPWVATACVGLAILFNLKLAPASVLLLVLSGFWFPLIVLTSLAGGIFVFWSWLDAKSFREVWYGSIVVAKRMLEWRKSHNQDSLPHWDHFFATPLLLVSLALVAIVMSEEPMLWFVAAIYISTNLLGRIWRPYHWIPIAAVFAAAAPPIAFYVLIAELVASGLYLGDVVSRVQPQAASLMHAARSIGEQVRLMNGSLWVNSEFTQIYVYSRKRPAYSFVEQVELRHVIPERRENLSIESRPDILVMGPAPFLFAPSGYQMVLRHGGFVVFRSDSST